MRLYLAIVFALVPLACGAHTGTEAKEPKTPPGAAREPAPVAPERSDARPRTVVAIPAPPAECAAHVGSIPAVGCDERPAALAALAAALEETDSVGRSRALGGLEGCSSFEPGIVRALRAETAPRGCADAVLGDAVEDGRLRRDVRDAIVGLSIAAKLSRLTRDPPRLEPPYDKGRFMAFFRETFVPWIAEQAAAIQVLSEEGARVGGYGQGIVAVEAGLADMRFVEAARSIPLPAEMDQDPEVRDVYYAALDESLEPRKTRGRDAALVGLRRFAELGVVEDARVQRTRSLLSELLGGRRIDALDGLLRPEPRAAGPASVEHRLARALPPFYAAYVISDMDYTTPQALSALLRTGFPPSVLARLRAGSLSEESTKLLARGFIKLGQRYWRADDFKAAVLTLAPLTSGRKVDGEAEFLSALATVLSGGPRDAAQMMLEGPRYPAGVGNVAPLDAVKKNRGPHAAIAAFDAAYILRLVPPLEPKPEYFDDLARRFREAARALKGDAKARAEDMARAADDTAKAIRGGMTRGKS
jgi:hypothetical protein